VHDAEHALYLLAGCLFFLVAGGTEPLRHRVSVIGAFLMLLITMLSDSGIGVVYTFQSREVFAPYARVVRGWGPSLVTDLHAGGYIMIFGSDAVMSIIAITLTARSFRSASGSMLPGGSRGHASTGSDARLGAYNEYLRRLDSHADA
jgi:cytochrome c oxidase assembly factor CtaG